MDHVKASIPTFRGLVAGALLATALAGCATSQPDAAQKAREVEKLAEVVPIVEHLAVSDYNNRDWCRHLTYARGEFTSDTEQETSTCNDYEGTPAPFDAQASADFDRLKQALSDTGIDVRSVSRYIDGGGAQIVFFVEHLTWDRWYYVYDPGAPLPEDMEGERRSVRVNDDWYWQWEDWN